MDLPSLPYRNVREIGVGGFAHIYTGRTTSDNTVLIKIFKSRKNVEWLIRREFNFSSTLDHPNIRKALTYNLRHLYIVFEYCPGIDLFDYLDEFDETTTTKLIPLFTQVLDAVGYLHENGVAHMDLKLENFIYNPGTNQLTLIDFGQALLLNDDEVRVTGLHGTTQYLPPEFYRKHPVIFFDKVDVWCCGMILYNLIYNRMPWHSASNDDELYRLVETWMNLGKLCPHTFSSMAEYGVNENDENILKNIFLGIFVSCPLKRMTLRQLRNEINSLSLLKFENNFLNNIKSNGRCEFSSKHIYKQRWATN